MIDTTNYEANLAAKYGKLTYIADRLVETLSTYMTQREEDVNKPIDSSIVESLAVAISSVESARTTLRVESDWIARTSREATP